MVNTTSGAVQGPQRWEIIIQKQYYATASKTDNTQSPALASLELYLLTNKSHTLALVWLWRPLAANYGCELTDCLLVMS